MKLDEFQIDMDHLINDAWVVFGCQAGIMIDMCMMPSLMTWFLGLDFSATGMHICAMTGELLEA